MQLQDLRQIRNHYQYIYIAPHFDDVAISCGGTIARHSATGQATLVVTVCGGLPDRSQVTTFARFQHRQWGVEKDPITVRRQEDLTAVAHLGADLLWLPDLDAIYRHPAYDSDPAIFGAVRDDDPLPPILRRRLLQVAEHAPSAVYYFPLAIGNHVDHQIAFAVGCLLADRGIAVAFYEDLPYALDARAVEERLRSIEGPLIPDVVDITTSLPRKLGAVAEYRTQIPILFDNEEEMINALTQHASFVAPDGSTYAERFWMRAVAQ